MTTLEVLVASVLALLVAIATYDFFESSNKSYVRESELANARNTGRVALDELALDLRQAGYTPLGAQFYAVQAGDDEQLLLYADFDGDAVVGVAGEDDENVCYVFSDNDSDGLFELLRGEDYDGDWQFTGAGESFITLARNVVPIDFDGDGTDEPFLAYDVAPPTAGAPFVYGQPATSRVTITFGIRTDHRDWQRKEFGVARFRSDVVLRNRL
jgi:hypothetical protein